MAAYALGLPASLAALAKAFDRSPWLALLFFCHVLAHLIALGMAAFTLVWFLPVLAGGALRAGAALAAAGAADVSCRAVATVAGVGEAEPAGG